MVQKEDDKIPLTTSSPSITQETRARFDALLNAALKDKGPPKVFKRSNAQILKQRVDKSPSKSSVTSQSDVNSNSNGNVRPINFVQSLPPIEKKTNIREVSALVHTSRSNLLSSSEEDVKHTTKKKKKLRKLKSITKNQTVDKKESFEMSPLRIHEQVEDDRLSNRSYTLESPTVPAEIVPVIATPPRVASPLSNRSYVIDMEASVENLEHRKSSIQSCVIDIDSTKSVLAETKPKTPVPLPRRKTLEKIERAEVILSPARLVSQEVKALTRTASEDTDGSQSLTRAKTKKKRKRSRTRENGGEDIEMKVIATPTSRTKTPMSTPGTISSTRFQNEPGEQIVGVTVHGTDYLKPQPHIKHPMVRIHIVDMSTGEYLAKSSPDRPVCFFDENSPFILPIMTHPFQFQEKRSLLPQWEELLVFNENLHHLVTPTTLLLFEIVDFVNFNLGSSRYRSLGSEGGWIKIAWAFLKLVAVNGANNLDRRLRLQLFCPKSKKKKVAAPNSPLVYSWWSSGDRKKYPATLYVTVAGVIPPQDPVLPGLRSRVALQQEQGSVASLGSVSVVNSDDEANTLNSYCQVPEDPEPITWTRLPGQSCKLPNMRAHSLPVGSCGSMSVRFSHSGLHLACGTSGDIYVFSIPSASLYAKLSAHQGLVYSVRWSSDDRLLVSASADCTVCVWDVRHKKSTPIQVLPHPSFVYCAQFLPECTHRAIVTGCRDGILRLWYQHNPGSFKLTAEAVGHSGFINAVCFTKDNKFILSGDSEGGIRMWCLQDTDLCLMQEISVRELRGVTINNLVAHPGGNRLLVHSRDNLLRMVDIATGAVIQWFRGCMNERLQTGSCLTPCGGTVLACCDDSTLCAWDSNTGVQVAMYVGIYTRGCASVDYHPYEHMVVLGCYEPSQYQPIILAKYDRNSSGKELGLKFLLPTDDGEKLAKKTASSDSIWEQLSSTNSNASVKPRKTGNTLSVADLVEAKVKPTSSDSQSSLKDVQESDVCSVKDERLLNIIRRMDRMLLAVKPISPSK